MKLLFIATLLSLSVYAQSDTCVYEPNQTNATSTVCTPLSATDTQTVKQILQNASDLNAQIAAAQQAVADAQAALSSAQAAEATAQQALDAATADVAAKAADLATAQAALDSLQNPIPAPEPTPTPSPTPDPTDIAHTPITTYPATFIPQTPTGCTVDASFMPQIATICPTVLPRPVPGVCGSYTDPVYGNTVKIIRNDGAINDYSTPSALSATGKYALVDKGGNGYIISTADCSTVVVNNVYGLLNQNRPWFWDPTDDDVFFFAKADAGVMKIFKVNVSNPAQQTVVLDTGTPFIFTGGTGSITGDRWMVYADIAQRPASLTAAQVAAAKICIAPLDGTNDKYCMPISSIPNFDAHTLDFMLLSGIDEVAGKRFVLVEEAGNVLQFDGQTLSWAFLPGERPDAVTIGRGNGDGICDPGELCMGPYLDHSDVVMVANAQGQQEAYVSGVGIEWSAYPKPNGTTGYQRQTMMWKLNSSALGWYTDAIPLGTFSGNHFSCAKTSPRCVSSAVRNPQKAFSATLTSPPSPTSGGMQGEILVVEIPPDHVPIVHRGPDSVAYAVGVTNPNDYYSIPRAGISGDGKMVIWTTTLGESVATNPRKAVISTVQ